MHKKKMAKESEDNAYDVLNHLRYKDYLVSVHCLRINSRSNFNSLLGCPGI